MHSGPFVAPCCILFGIFFLLPLVLSIAFSFTNYDGWKVMDFVGIKNYITLFKIPNSTRPWAARWCTPSAACPSA